MTEQNIRNLADELAPIMEKYPALKVLIFPKSTEIHRIISILIDLEPDFLMQTYDEIHDKEKQYEPKM